MVEKCKNCGKALEDFTLTHCSEECIFEGIRNSKSIGSTPIEEWDSDTWV